MSGKIDKVYTFLADISRLENEREYRSVYEQMPDFRKEKADRLRRMEDKARSVGAWRLYMLASERYPISSETPFNLSHSGKYVLCSVAPDGESVGCDVEGLRVVREQIARRFFCPQEAARLMKLKEEERAGEFIRLWVLKESFMKATRRGMSLGLDTFAFDFPEGGAPSLVRQPEDIKGRYYFYEYPANSAKIAVCSTCPAFSPYLEQLSI